MSQVDAPEQLLSLPECGEVLRVSRRTVERIIRRGDLAVVRIGGRTRVRPADLEAFIASRTQAGARAA